MFARALTSLLLLAASATASREISVSEEQRQRILNEGIMLDFSGMRGDWKVFDASDKLGMGPKCVMVEKDGDNFKVHIHPENMSPDERRRLEIVPQGVDLQIGREVPPTAIQIPFFYIPIEETGWLHVYAITVDYWASDPSKHFCDFSGFVHRYGEPGPGPIIPWAMEVSPAEPTDSVGRRCISHRAGGLPGSDCLLGGFSFFGYPYLDTDGSPAGGCGAGLETIYQPFIEGEPHFAQWNGHKFDYQGECDLVFAHAPKFDNGVGLDIHVRTKIRYDYSFIETAAIKIGNDVLEVSSYGDYFLNGVLRADLEGATLAGHPITYKQPMDKKSTYDIELGGGNVLAVSSMKDIVSIRFVLAQDTEGLDLLFEWFGSSAGMIGSLDFDKSMMGRDGVTRIQDANAYGQEWQVRGSDPQLFHIADRAPQYPEKCNLPSADAYQTNRRLGVGISREEAAKACASWPQEQKENCINDVIAMGDLEFAKAGSY